MDVELLACTLILPVLPLFFVNVSLFYLSLVLGHVSVIENDPYS